MIAYPPKSYVETLPPNGMILEGRVFGRYLGVDEVIRMEPL